MKFIGHIQAFVSMTFIMLLTACSSQIPAEISLKPDNAPNVSQVREQLDMHISKKIRWGGIILQIENRQKTSLLTIVSMPLNTRGVPQNSTESGGRFMAEVDEFLEPLVYSRDRRITVTGHIVRSETHKVGEFLYDYPVIDVDVYYLWPKITVPADSDYPFYRQRGPRFYPGYHPWQHPHPYLYPNYLKRDH